MAVQEAEKPNRGTEEPAEAGRGPSWLARVNEFGERHAKIIITVSTALVILTVLVFAKHFYDKAQIERAESELSNVDRAEKPVEKLAELKKIYGATPSGPRILYHLANRLYEEGRLDEAKKEYDEFLAFHAGHPLAASVKTAKDSLEKNQRFLASEREGRLKSQHLQSHPRRMADLKDPRFQWGPPRPERPEVEIETGGGRVKVMLLEDEAPKAVASFLKLVEAKHFDEVKWDVVGEAERVQTQPKPPAAAEALPFEAPLRPADAYSLVMVKKEGAAENVPGQFQILLKDLPSLKDATILGIVTESAPILAHLKKDDPIKSIKAVSKTAVPTGVEKSEPRK